MNATLFLQKGQGFLARQPRNVLIDAQLHFPVTEKVLRPDSFVHGGVVSDAVDNALADASGSACGMPVITFAFKISYDQPVIGEWLIARPGDGF